jgi:hypothetical protein
MTDKQRLEIYLANLDKALGLVDDTDDLSLLQLSNGGWLVNYKLDIYNRISNLMNRIEKVIEGV